jgi:hypothetical protein
VFWWTLAKAIEERAFNLLELSSSLDLGRCIRYEIGATKKGRRVKRILGHSALLMIGFVSNISTSLATPKVVLHVVPFPEQVNCSSDQIPCSAMVVNADLYPELYYAFMCGVNDTADAGISKIEFGIRYEPVGHRGVDIFSWTTCGSNDLPTPNWPQSESGNVVIWNECVRSDPGGQYGDAIACAGYFYLSAYTADQLRIIPYHQTQDSGPAVTDCSERRLLLPSSEVGFVAFSAGAQDSGYNPCGIVTPTQGVTWSKVKIQAR